MVTPLKLNPYQFYFQNLNWGLKFSLISIFQLNQRGGILPIHPAYPSETSDREPTQTFALPWSLLDPQVEGAIGGRLV